MSVSVSVLASVSVLILPNNKEVHKFKKHTEIITTKEGHAARGAGHDERRLGTQPVPHHALHGEKD